MKSIFARNDTGATAIEYARRFRAERRLSAMPAPVRGGLDISGRNRTHRTQKQLADKGVEAGTVTRR
jgi:hypothetical protein